MVRQISAASAFRNRKSVTKKHKFLRTVVTVFNIIFMVIGLTLLALGVVTMVIKSNYISLLSNPTYCVVTYMLVALSAVVLTIVVVGCVGVMKEQRPLLLLYSVMLVVLCLAEAVAGVLAYTYHTTINEELHRQFNSTLRESYNVDSSQTRSIDHLQKTFHCCGSRSYLDWRGSRWISSNQTSNLVPDSCCITPSDSCGIRDHPSNIYTLGCISHLIEFTQSHLMILGAVALSVALVQVFGMVFACCLARRVKLTHESLKDVSLISSN